MDNRLVRKVSTIALLSLMSVNVLMSNQALTFSGIRVHLLEYEYLKGFFTDEQGNYLFMFSNGKNSEQGNAWILKMRGDGSDTVIRCFALPDTNTCFYTGFCTPQQTYMFFGQICQDTLPLYSNFGYLWVLETDTLLNVISSKRYAVPVAYNKIIKMKGFSLSPGKFTLLGEYYAPSSTAYSDDLFLAQFDYEGDTLNTTLLNLPMHQSLVYALPGLEQGTFTALVKGLNISVDNQRMVIDAEMNFQLFDFIGGNDIQTPISFVWVNDSLMLVAGEKADFPEYDWDIHLCLASVSNTFYQDYYFGSFGNFDLPAMKQAVAPSADNGYYFAGTLKINDYLYADTMLFCKLDSNFNICWTLKFYDNLNYVVQAILLKPDGDLLVAASTYDNTQPSYGRDLFFFTLAPGLYTDSGPTTPPASGRPYRIFTENDGGGLSIESAQPGIFFVHVFDITGREVIGRTKCINSGIFNVTGRVPGIYLIEIQSVSGEKIVIKWYNEH
jgi:hypothetical protein